MLSGLWSRDHPAVCLLPLLLDRNEAWDAALLHFSKDPFVAGWLTDNKRAYRNALLETE